MSAIAPFIDLANMARELAAELAGSTLGTEIALDLIHDPSIGAPPLVGSRPLSFDQVTKIYAAVILPSGGEPEKWMQTDSFRRDWLRAQYTNAAWIGAIGSGVMALVAAGLLNEGPASVPPRFGRLIRMRYPDVRLAHVGTLAENGRLITASEPSSVFALVVALAARIHSHGLAERYRRRFGVAEVSILGQPILPARNNNDILVAEARAWILAHMHESIDSAAIAARFNVSPRTLMRRFQRSTGATPAQFVRDARMEAARSMLQRTAFSVEQIAHLVGYRDIGFFRRLFRRCCGHTPHSFRMKLKPAQFDTRGHARLLSSDP